MEITEIFKDGLQYPFNDIQKFVILGLIFCLTFISFFLLAFAGDSTSAIILLLIIMIINLIIGIYTSGYYFNVVENTIKKNDELPEFELVNTLINGLKVILIGIVYGIVPFIFTILIAFLSGAIYNLGQIMTIVINGDTVPEALALSTLTSFTIVILLSALVSLIFGLLSLIAIARAADKEKLSAAFEFGEIINAIKQIGIVDFIIWFILFAIIICVISMISSIFMSIPILGLLIMVIIEAYILIFSGRVLGLLYNEA